MKVLMVHDYYQQRGGEDASFEAELSLLRAGGVDVEAYTVHNDEVSAMSPLQVGLVTVWNARQQEKLHRLLLEKRFDVVHFQNTFPLISPAPIRTAKRLGAAVVQSVRNYRLACVNGLFFRDGRVCEDCLGRLLQLPGIAHACYRGSRAASATVAAMNLLHRALGTWRDHVDVFIALSAFTREKLVEIGLPRESIYVKPNVVMPDPGPGDGSGGYAAFVGRLSPEKGLDVLLTAWESIGGKLPLHVVGDGPLRGAVAAVAERAGAAVAYRGQLSGPEVLEVLGRAAVLVFPSVWYETFGRVAIEALARGTPVIVSNMGAMSELVEDGVTGFRFAAGDAADLVRAVERFLADDTDRAAMRARARETYLERYSPEVNLAMLREAYETALLRARSA